MQFCPAVASNKEDRVREALARKVKIEGLEQLVRRRNPRCHVSECARQARPEARRRATATYPGYVFIEMLLDKHGHDPRKSLVHHKGDDGSRLIAPNGKPTR